MNTMVTYDVFHHIYWDWRVAMDLFLGGIGVGAYVYAVFISWWHRDEYPEISKIGAVIAPLFVAIGLIFLLRELGHPERIYKTLLGFHPTAPIWWGGIFQPLFIMVSALYAFLWVKNLPGQVKLRKTVGWIGVPLALLVGGYHGFLLTVVKAKPLWHAEPTTVMAVLSFCITGIAAVVLVLSFFEPRRIMKAVSLTRNILGGLITFQLLTVAIWIVTLTSGSEITKEAFFELNRHFGVLFWAGGIVMGLIAPLFIGLLVVLWYPKQDWIFKITRIATSLMILVGAFIFRYCIILSGQIV